RVRHRAVAARIGTSVAQVDRGLHVERAPEGVDAEETEAGGEPALDLRRQTVVPAVDPWLDAQDTCRSDRLQGAPRGNGSRTGRGLAAFVSAIQLNAVVADISDLPHGVLRHFLLNAEVPLFHVRNGITQGPASNLRRRLTVKDIRRRIGRRGARGKLPAQRDRARDVELVAVDRVPAETDERRVVGHPLAYSEALVLHEKDSGTAAHHHRFWRLPCKSHARGEIIEVGRLNRAWHARIARYHELAVERAPGINHQVRKAAPVVPIRAGDLVAQSGV